MARTCSYTAEMADAICARLADGESLRSVCRDDGMPDKQTVFSWMRKYPEFLDQYTRAKEESADALVDEMVDIADNEVSQAIIVDGLPLLVDGKPVMVTDAVSVNHARLRVETRKWAASKLKPKKYGDKLDLNHGGELRYSFAMDYGHKGN